MSVKNEYYIKILQAWIAKMKDNGFKFTIQKAFGNHGIDLEYHRADGNTNMVMVVSYYDETFTIDKLFDCLHKLELIIPKLIEEPKAPIRSIDLSYYPYSYYDSPYLIKTSSDLPNDKRYFTYIDNGKFKTIVGNAY